jgi:hypothetical protein
MELPLTELQENQIYELARHVGKAPAELLVETAMLILTSYERRWTDVEHSLAQAERGELLEEDETDQREVRMLAK